MVYGYIQDEYNNMNFVNLQKQAINEFSPIYNYSIDKIIVDTNEFLLLEEMVNQMEKGDKLITCGCSTQSLSRDRLNRLLDKLKYRGIKILFIPTPEDIIIYEMNLCLKRINNRGK